MTAITAAPPDRCPSCGGRGYTTDATSRVVTFCLCTLGRVLDRMAARPCEATCAEGAMDAGTWYLCTIDPEGDSQYEPMGPDRPTVRQCQRMAGGPEWSLWYMDDDGLRMLDRGAGWQRAIDRRDASPWATSEENRP